MPLQIAGQNYAHMWSDMYKGIDPQGPYYELSYLFDDWQKADAVANAMAGYTVRVGTFTNRVPPHQHPLSPNLYCQGLRIEGLGTPILNANGLPNYSGGFKLTTSYRAVTTTGQFNPSDDPQYLNQIDPTTPILWCTQEIDSTTQNLSMSNHQYKFASSGKLTGIPQPIRIHMTIMRLTFHKVPYLPMGAFRNYRNKVNSKLFLGAPPGTVLFNRYSTTREASTDGTVNQRVTVEFHERDQDWNAMPDPTLCNAFDRVVDHLGNSFLQTADLNQAIAALV